MDWHAVFSWIEASALSTWVRESPSMLGFPAIIAAHAIGMGLLVGACAAMDLRLLGFAPRIPLSSTDALMPVIHIGFWVNAISGVALFVGDATTKGTTWVFMTKLGIIAVGVILLLALKRTVYGRGEASAIETPTSRALAAASLALWFLAIVTGRYMAYV